MLTERNSAGLSSICQGIIGEKGSATNALARTLLQRNDIQGPPTTLVEEAAEGQATAAMQGLQGTFDILAAENGKPLSSAPLQIVGGSAPEIAILTLRAA